MKITKILAILMLIVLSASIVYIWVEYFNLKEKGIEIVKCYDAYHNEIIGEECIKDNVNMSTPFILTLLAFLIMPLLYAIYTYRIGGYL